jgi:hypothetical protein
VNPKNCCPHLLNTKPVWKTFSIIHPLPSMGITSHSSY